MFGASGIALALFFFALFQQYRIVNLKELNEQLDTEIRESLRELHMSTPPDFCLRDITELGIFFGGDVRELQVRFTTLAGHGEFMQWLKSQVKRARRHARTT
jgi:hypothetical protein